MSYYKTLTNRLTKKKNLGYNYSGRIISDNTPPSMMKNVFVIEFFEKIEESLTHLIDSVKVIRLKLNYFLPKDSKDLH